MYTDISLPPPLFFLLLFIAAGGSSWADDVADLPSARKYLSISWNEKQLLLGLGNDVSNEKMSY